MRGLISLLLLFSFSLIAKESDLFFIKRSKNANQVAYSIKTDDTAPCDLLKSEIKGYWKELEQGPNVTNPLTTIDKMAYGIDSQSIVDGWLIFTLKAIKDREFRVRLFSKDGNKSCTPEVMTTINKKWEFIESVYVNSKEGMLMPTVQYVDIFGKNAKGEDVTERITP